MQHLLRAISGPLAGAVYVLGRRTTLGRASDSDIQVLHEGVSRQHAKITLDAEGTMVLVDLSSDNGTYVEGQRISRHRLQPGEMFRIMTSQFVYEVLDSAEAETSEAFRRKVTSGDSLRQTANLSVSTAGFRSSGSSARSAGLVRTAGARPTSRPQAAAPALSGARPGAAVSSPSEPVLGPRTRAQTQKVPASMQQLELSEELELPEQEDEDGESATGRTLGYGEARRFPFSRPEVQEEGSTYGFHAHKGSAPERIIITPSSLARATTPPGGTAVPSEPPPGPSATEPEAAVDRPAVASPQQGSSPSRGRIAAPLQQTPGSMRPRATGSGMRGVKPDPSSAPAGPSRAEPTPVEPGGRWYARGPARSASPRQGTAEYGAMGSDAPARPPSRTGDGSSSRGGARTGATQQLVARPAAPGEGARLRPWKSRTRSTISAQPGPPEHSPSQGWSQGDRPDGAPIEASADPLRSSLASARNDPGDSMEETIRFQRDGADASDAEDPGPADDAGGGAASELGELLGTVADGGNDELELGPESGMIVSLGGEPSMEASHETLIDILECRELRLRSLRGEALGSQDMARYSELEDQLQQRPVDDEDPAAMRRYQRFTCCLPIQLMQRTDEGEVETSAAELADISAGGARIIFTGGALELGDVVWLAVDLLPADRSRLPEPEADAVVLAARVVWSQPTSAEIGLIFAGAPRYERDMAAGI